MQFPQYLKDYDLFQPQLTQSENMSAKLFIILEQKEKVCFANSNDHVEFTNCMMQFEGEFQQHSRWFQIKYQYLLRSTQECFKQNADTRNYDQCKGFAKEELNQIVNDHFNVLQKL